MTEPSQLIVRRATADDSDLLLRWRNDPETRLHSKKTGKVSETEHDAWLKRTLGNAAIRLFIAELNGIAVGTVRANGEVNSWALSWTVAPESRGKNIGYMAVKTVVEQLPGVIVAEVKVSNPASIQIVKKLGMDCKSAKEGMTSWVLKR